MNTLTEQFYDVMHKYGKSFGIAGVQKNLEQWKAGKKDLHALLQKHPDWNEDEMAVVLHYEDIRDIDRSCVDEGVFEMTQLAKDCGLCGELFDNFTGALDAATRDYLDEVGAAVLAEHTKAYTLDDQPLEFSEHLAEPVEVMTLEEAFRFLNAI